jgi:soluble lytic murein transglycosylase
LEHQTVAHALWRGAARDTGFYGRLAREALGDARLPEAVRSPTPAEVREVARDPGIQRAVVLHALGQMQDAAGEWAWATRGFDDRQLAAAAAHARRLQLWNRVIDSAEQMHDGHDLALRYPAPYRKTVRRAARRFEVDESWVYGVMHQESRFSLQAVSHKGARGIMQIMPDTARWLAGELGWDGAHEQLLMDPERAIPMGARYLRQLEGDLGGSAVVATAAYNAGPGRAGSWRASRPLEGAIYAESIPFVETRDYVQRVMAASVHYAELLSGRPHRLRQYMGVVQPPARGRAPGGQTVTLGATAGGRLR